MLVNVSELRRERDAQEIYRGSVMITPAELALVGVVAVRPATFEATLTNRWGSFAVAGRACTVVRVPCGRCGGESDLQVEATWETMYRPGPEGSAGEIREGEEGQEWVLFEGNQIDLRPAALEALSLALPMRPLCRPDCRGLCPACGQDLNEGVCECRVEPVDHRWATLEEFAHKRKGV
jgi:uncharacterized protein